MFAMHTDRDLKTQHNSTQITSEIPRDASGGEGNNEETTERDNENSGVSHKRHPQARTAALM